MEERRKYIRVNALIKIVYKILSPADGVCPAESTDLSIAGIRIKIDEELPLHSVLGMELFLPSNPEQPLRVKGEVIWQRKLSEEDREKFEAGIKFYEIEKEDLERLYEDLRQFVQEEKIKKIGR